MAVPFFHHDRSDPKFVEICRDRLRLVRGASLSVGRFRSGPFYCQFYDCRIRLNLPVDAVEPLRFLYGFQSVIIEMTESIADAIHGPNSFQELFYRVDGEILILGSSS